MQIEGWQSWSMQCNERLWQEVKLLPILHERSSVTTGEIGGGANVPTAMQQR